MYWYSLQIKWDYKETFFRYDTDRTENDGSNNSSTVACVRFRGNVYTERNVGGNTKTDESSVWSTPLSWVQVPRYTYQESPRYVLAFKHTDADSKAISYAYFHFFFTKKTSTIIVIYARAYVPW
jgi:hypothetical protein